MAPLRLLLCSASPRRRELLERLGLQPALAAPQVDETPLPGEPGADLALRLCRAKAQAGCQMPAAKGCAVLAADTVVLAPSGETLGKPTDRAEARRMLGALAGRTHGVVTAVCLRWPGQGGQLEERTAPVHTRVRFAQLTPGQIAWLADSGDGDDKAGAYAVQGLAGAFIDRLEGSFTNVVGLPLTETARLLEEAGVSLPWRSA